MDGKISIETRMSCEDLKKFTWFSILKRGKRLKKLYLFFIASIIVVYCCIAYIIISEGFEAFFKSSVAYLVTLVIIPPCFYLLMNYTIEKNYTKYKFYEATQRYEFTPEIVKVETTGENLSGNAEYQYEALYEAFESKDSFYLYINQHQAQLLTKRSMDTATQDGLRSRLETKLGKKYIKCF